MATSLYDLLKEHKVVIPIVQRDYAQGRLIGKAPVIREGFLNALCKALTERTTTPLELDFVYGYIREHQVNGEKIKSFIPLDGQQRLTTLFLLHWFVAVKENKLAEARQFLEKFTYETRHSSKVFCEKLVKYVPADLSKSIKATIINEPWFFTAWKNDPTVSSMLIMLDAIQNKFINLDDVWILLTSDQPKIVFHLLPMERLGLPDDLYIKMNSRGKELTEFEYFKSRFSELLTTEEAAEFNHKVDKEWSDLFWDLYKDQNISDIAKLVDNGFLRFFRFVTDIIAFRNNYVVEEHTEEFEVYKKIYGDSANVSFLFSCLNQFYQINSENPAFFNDLFYIQAKDFVENKTRLFFNNPVLNIFKKCADNYDASTRINQFSIGEQLMLFACILHLVQGSTDVNTRLRTVRNLITNSEDTVRKENMPALLDSVAGIILNNTIDEETKFNSRQVKEEIAKQDFISQNNQLKEVVFKLEDHHLLQGCIAIFKLETDLNKFASVFYKVYTPNCNYDSIGKALMCFNDYSQKYDWRRRLGNNNHSVWRELFTPSQRRDSFENTQKALYMLLSYLIQNPELDEIAVISGTLESYNHQENQPKDWRYYFIKYSEFRRNEEGFYYWPDPQKQYESVMMRRTTLGGFHWSPFLVAIKNRLFGNVILENYGAPLILVKGNMSLKVRNHNIGFKLEAVDEESKDFLEAIKQLNYLNSNDIITIKQNEDGLDIEDRVARGVAVFSEIITITLPVREKEDDLILQPLAK